jgi:hypothetical protein
MIPDENQRSVIAFGCPNGVDWSVHHAADGKMLTLTTRSGRAHDVDRAIYRKAIFEFADAVEAFYAAAKNRSSCPRTGRSATAMRSSGKSGRVSAVAGVEGQIALGKRSTAVFGASTSSCSGAGRTFSPV